MTRNFELPYIPERTSKPRKAGLTMMMDKGMSLSETAAFIEGNHELTDLAKFGFGTSMITPNLKEKIKLYKDAGIRPYFGGTLFEIFLARNKFNDYKKLLDKFGMDLCEVSDGSIIIPHDKKLRSEEHTSEL